MPRVGDQRHGIAEETEDELKRDNADIDRDSEHERTGEIGRAVIVAMVVTGGHAPRTSRAPAMRKAAAGRRDEPLRLITRLR